LAEDFADTRLMLRSLLEAQGYRVVEASNGKEAVELAAKSRPDLILMDLSLPVLDGLTATRLIRNLEGMGEVPVVVVSAHAAEDFYLEARAAGCTEYVTKPFDFDELDQVIGRLVTRRLMCEVI
jgi:CheY-like chemotaxis protein